LLVFMRGEAAARMDLKLGQRLALTCKLNGIYTSGLLALLTGADIYTRSKLLEDAVITEHLSRLQTPPAAYDGGIQGGTIIVDMAWGIGQDMASMKHLSNDPQYKVAREFIFGDNPVGWDYFLIVACFPYKKLDFPQVAQVNYDNRRPGYVVKPDLQAKALLLGANIMLSLGCPDERLVHSYAFELQYMAGLLAQNNTSPGVRENICATLDRFPPHIRKYRSRRELAK